MLLNDLIVQRISPTLQPNQRLSERIELTGRKTVWSVSLMSAVLPNLGTYIRYRQVS